MTARKPFFIYCEIYCTNIYFCPGFTSEEMSEAILELTGVEYSKDFFRCFGSTIWVNGEKNAGIFVWVEPAEYSPEIASTITHESIHAANCILHGAGVGVTLENDEAQAYLAGWIAKKITEFYFSKCSFPSKL